MAAILTANSARFAEELRRVHRLLGAEMSETELIVNPDRGLDEALSLRAPSKPSMAKLLMIEVARFNFLTEQWAITQSGELFQKSKRRAVQEAVDAQP